MAKYYVVLSEWSCDFEQGTEVLAIKNSLCEAKEVFNAYRDSERIETERNGWIVTDDTDMHYEAGEEGRWVEGHTKLYIRTVVEDENEGASKQIDNLKDILTSKPYGASSYDEFAEYLYENKVRVLPLKKTMYVVCVADNVGYSIGISASRTFEKKENAIEELKNIMQGIREIQKGKRIILESESELEYRVTFEGDDTFYATIEAIDVELKI